MEHQQKDYLNDNNEPFEIVRNARKNSKHLKSTASKSRKNSAISLADQKQKKIKKKPRKLTDYISSEDLILDQLSNPSPKAQQSENNIFMETILQFEEEQMMGQQKQRQQKEEMQLGQKQEEEFYFDDGEGEKGIMEGLGDENSLVGQFRFDFFNPEK